MTEHRHIGLHLPTGWNACTTEELEYIAAAIVDAQFRVDRYHPFNWARVKLLIVLAINGMEIVQSASRDNNITSFLHNDNQEADEYMVQREEDKEAWPITTGQLNALCERISWIDDKKASKVIFRFPYGEMTFSGGGEPMTVVGPPPLLDGYTWREYRWLTDWMQRYMSLGNAIAQGKSEKGKVNNLLQQQEHSRNEFLAVLFKPKDDGGSNNPKVTADLFEGFSPIKWQVILFWWSSLMEQLERKFPKVFKKQPVGKSKQQPKMDTPWDFYNRVTATVQKYIGGLSAEDVDSQPYSVTLQQLEMMADEAAELERAKSKHH